jgi:hypothetical protein
VWLVQSQKSSSSFYGILTMVCRGEGWQCVPCVLRRSQVAAVEGRYSALSDRSKLNTNECLVIHIHEQRNEKSHATTTLGECIDRVCLTGIMTLKLQTRLPAVRPLR